MGAQNPCFLPRFSKVTGPFLFFFQFFVSFTHFHATNWLPFVEVFRETKKANSTKDSAAGKLVKADCACSKSAFFFLGQVPFNRPGSEHGLDLCEPPLNQSVRCATPRVEYNMIMLSISPPI